jgi:hypothetical protein
MKKILLSLAAALLIGVVAMLLTATTASNPAVAGPADVASTILSNSTIAGDSPIYWSIKGDEPKPKTCNERAFAEKCYLEMCYTIRSERLQHSCWQQCDRAAKLHCEMETR